MMDALFVDSDSDSYSEFSDSENQDCNESLFGGHAQSILSGLDESIGKIDDFLAFERNFALGDFVCSITDPSGQLGRVVDVDLIVDLETTSGGLIKDVNSKRLHRLRSFASGDFVVYGPWLGRIEKTFDAVTILFNNGAKFEILIRDSKDLTLLYPSFEDASFPLHPGQRVKINLPTISQSKAWLCGSLKASQDEGIICHVEVGLVYVSWLASVVGQSIHSSTPPHFQDPKNLTLLSCFSHVNWQLGDRCTLPVDYHNMTAENSGTLSSPKCFTNMQKELDMESLQMFVIAKTRSKVDVLWQNGERSVGVCTQSLSPVSNIGDHDFWPGQFVLEKVTSDEVHVPQPQGLGIVKNVDSHEQIVNVKWMHRELNKNVDFSGEFTEETVSAYELIEHPDFTYCIGDVVIRQIPCVQKVGENILDVQNISWKERHNLPVAVDGLFCGIGSLKKPIDECNHEDLQVYLSCIGNVIGYKDEGIEVKWASGVISKVLPFEIVGLDRLLHPALTPSATMESFPPNVDKDLTDQEKQLWNMRQKKAADDSGGFCMKDVWKAASALFPGAAFGFLTHVATSLFCSGGSTSLPDPEFSQYRNSKTEEYISEPTDLQPEILKQQIEETKQSGGMTFSPGSDEPRKFKQFDIVNDHTDHHFVDGIGNELMLSHYPQVKKGWFKKVQQEWSFLKNDLPDTIYVRVYEERMDLLRASMIGAPGTPYHDGLFFFDIFLPFDYPHEPPVVHYISGGLRLNPNLYESGKVCLSLLKTWMGSGSEVWDPENSTILQVLLSLQALVLNEKPYFNEAGYDEQIGRVEAEKNSITYNENAFLQSCKSMLYILRRPPKHFEALVEEHFTQRSHHILSACKAYLDGAQVGHSDACREAADKCHNSCSTGFKIMLAKLLPKLVSAFTERGIDCTQFLDVLN
ncbi:hypothetical protein MUK42_33910 [Musa troglodytarum]|uniref:E2 ubiquitin-conjugating enzyme n=1 Tax=Musa troglodytarum TaxID=320322 RepID=A0A9E7HRF2_9LILI|nr:hypothetical protein MUK42_33910 [Musa troglodytarum]